MDIPSIDIPSIVQAYGYPAVFVGTFLEGEAVLLAAGFAAHSGYLSLPVVAAVAVCASFLGDQAFFWVGRRHGVQLVKRFPALMPRIDRARALLQRHHLPIIVSVRFLYGFRIAGPIAIGMSGVGWRRFMVLDFIGAIAWALTVSGLGYGIGHGFEYLIEDLRRHEATILLGILAAGFAVWLWRAHRARAGAPGGLPKS